MNIVLVGKIGSGVDDIAKRLLKDRIIMLGTAIDDQVADIVVAQLLYLEGQDPDKDISLYINSPGGSISAGMAIHDTLVADVHHVLQDKEKQLWQITIPAETKTKRT